MQPGNDHRTRFVPRLGYVLVAGMLVWALTQGNGAFSVPHARAEPKSTEKDVQKEAPDDPTNAIPPDERSRKLGSLGQQPVRGTKTDGKTTDKVRSSPTKWESGLPELNEMLQRARKIHPSVREAEAKVALARAELDQARLQVAQEVIDARKEWRLAHAEVVTAKRELQEAERARGAISTRLIESANERLQITREELVAVEAHLELLLGKETGSVKEKKKAPAPAEREKILGQLHALAQQMVKVALADYRVGKADISTVLKARERVTRLEIDLAKAKADKRSAIDKHIQVLKELLKVAEARYRTGEASQSDVLAVQYALKEAELWKLEAK